MADKARGLSRMKGFEKSRGWHGEMSDMGQGMTIHGRTGQGRAGQSRAEAETGKDSAERSSTTFQEIENTLISHFLLIFRSWGYHGP